MQWEKGIKPVAEKPFEFCVAPKVEGSRDVVGQVSVDKENGPMAISFDVNLGWVAETLGPQSGHWKCMAKKARDTSLKKETKEEIWLGKRLGTSPLQELEPNITTQKRRKLQKSSKAQEHNAVRDGREAVAAEQHQRASCPCVELSGFRVTPGSPDPHR